MKKIIFAFLLTFIAANSVFLPTRAVAEDNCVWTQQPDGSTSGTCVDDNGGQYCVSCPSGTTTVSTDCPRVSCNGGN